MLASVLINDVIPKMQLSFYFVGLKRKLRNLALDKKALEEKCSELNQMIYQISQSDRAKGKNLMKPFISTVRANAQFPEVSSDAKDKPCGCTSSVNAASKKSNSTSKEIEKLKSDLKHAEDLVAVLRKHEEEKDREIKRLSCLFIGGRPVSALAKDCCYKDVSKISEDISVLQREKIEMTSKLADYEDRHEKLHKKWKAQREKINKLESQLKEISDAALYVEREANLRIKNQRTHIAELKENLNKNGSSIPQELKDLKRTIKEKIKQEQKHLFEIEYLKSKMSEQEQQASGKNSDLVAELIRERDILQNKLKLLDGSRQGEKCHTSDCNVHQAYCQLREKEAQISRLQEELCHLKTNQMSHHHQHGALTLTNNLRRAECERDCAQGRAQELKMENDSLNDKMKVLQDSKINDNKKIIKLEENITRLKLEIKDLQESKNPAFHTIKQLREENCELQIKLRSSDEDYKKLNTTSNQIKMLSQQTENVLMNVQNQLEFTKCELSERESQICCLNKSIDCLKDQIEKHSTEISKLKGDKSTLEREKEFYMMTLDKRNEKLHSVETKMESAMCLKETNRSMRMKIE
jgi:chromosome segregation ATPase